MHENARPDPERAAFIEERRSRGMDVNAPLGTVERVPPVKGARPRRVYFTDPSGVQWRVYDTSYGPPEGSPPKSDTFPHPTRRLRGAYSSRRTVLDARSDSATTTRPMSSSARCSPL